MEDFISKHELMSYSVWEDLQELIVNKGSKYLEVDADEEDKGDKEQDLRIIR